MKIELVTAIKPDEEICEAFSKVVSVLSEIQHGGYTESNIILQKFREKGITHLDGEISYLIKIGGILGMEIFDYKDDFNVEITSENNNNKDDDGLPF